MAEAHEAQDRPLPAEVRLRRSHAWAAIHVVGLNLGFSIIGLTVFDKEYLEISPSSVWDNISGGWAWDDNAFTTNQFGHPYFGNLSYNAARSNGIGFWGSAIYGFCSSLFWELVMETATPSINDQLFTPAGGLLLGEALHRVGYAIRWKDRSWFGHSLAVVVDPMGAVSRWTHGDAWAVTEPPPRFGYLSLGWNGLVVDFDAPAGDRVQELRMRGHVALSQSYGLPVDPRFRPRRPLDHFDLLVEGDFSEEQASLSLYTRGMLWGRVAHARGIGALGGVTASYDFTNPAKTRVAVVSLGLGGVVHAPLGRSWFTQITLNAGLIPFGAAGADVLADPSEGSSSHTSYHRGPGLASLLELKLGWRGRGLLYLNARGYYINGTYFDDGSEYLSYVRLGVIAGVAPPHALQMEGMFSARRADFLDARRDDLDTSAQLRVSYVFASDFEFGGGSGR